MKRLIAIFTIVIATIPLASLALAGDDPAIAVESGPATTDAGPDIQAPTNALAQVIEGIQADTRTKIHDLGLKLAGAVSGSSEAVELQRQIGQVKADAEATILMAIIEDAVSSGDEARRIEAEAALERLLNPDQYRTAATPTERPAPSH